MSLLLQYLSGGVVIYEYVSITFLNCIYYIKFMHDCG